VKDPEQIQYILYARKSSEGEDRQVESIPNQVEVLRELATRLKLNVVKELDDSKSAKTPYQRPGFDEMLRIINNGEASGILCFQINRLSRNPAESGILQQMLQDEKIKAIQTSDKRYLSDDNAVIFSVEASIGNQFIRDLRKNVKRGIAHKIRHGGLSGSAPEGYLNYTKDDVKLVKIDPKRFSVIRKAFDLFLTGDYTVPEIHRIMNDDWGFTTRPRSKPNRTDLKRRIGGGPIARSSMYHMFRNPRYAGLIPDPVEEGVFHKATFPAMITPDEYDQVQELLGKRGCPRLTKRIKFELRGFIRCGECDCMITAEKKKKKLVSGKINYHSYYHCTGKRPCNQKGSVREQDLADQVYQLLDDYDLSPNLYKWGVKALNELAKEEIIQRDDTQVMQFESIASIQEKLDNLLDLAEYGSITPQQHKERSDKWLKELKKRQKEQAKTAERAKNWYEVVGRTLELLTNANEKFATGDIHEKQEVLLAIGQNPVLLNGRLQITPNEWLIPIKDNIKALRVQELKVITEPDKIGIKAQEAISKTWYSRRDSNPQQRFRRPS
jgi:site-specific DNA recombinase